MTASSWIVALACLCAACGNAKTADSADVIDAASGSDGAGTDASGTDAVGTDAGVTDLGAKDAGKDTKAAGATAAETVTCLVACAGKDAACRAACVAASDADATALGACLTDLCADATTTAGAAGCAWAKCAEKLGAFAGAGAGTLACTFSAECAARCTLGDYACEFKCLASAAPPAVTAYGELRACVATACAGISAAALPSCVAAKCAAAGKTCRGTNPLSCLDLESCAALCPTSQATAPNWCLGACEVLGGAAELAAEATYATCKGKCSAAIDKADCKKKECSAAQSGCYVEAGTANCTETYTCIKANCDGIGGDPACIDGCVKKGQAWAQDAWVVWDGCIERQLATKQGEQWKCEFPYDQNTCIDNLIGCDVEKQACFIPQ